MKTWMPGGTDYIVRVRDRCTCQYCDLCGCGNFDIWMNLGIDHVVPIEKGGSDFADNKAVACGECNTLKSNYPPVGNNLEERIADARRIVQARREGSRKLFDAMMDDIAKQEQPVGETC